MATARPRFRFGLPGAPAARISVRESMRYNTKTFKKNPLGEIAGSLGDLGTLLPLMTAMSAAGTINLTSTLVISGLANIASGCVFGLPIAVQPMKAVAAISVARGLTLKETAGAGLSVAILVLLLSITGFLYSLGTRIPIPLVKGIQLGAGLSLMVNAGSQLASTKWTSPWGDNYIWFFAAAVVLCFTSRLGRFPYALILFTFGVMLAATRISKVELPRLGISLPPVYLIRWKDLRVGFITAGLGQLPLTILNSVIAVTYLSADLLPERPPPPITAVGAGVAGMNMIGCWVGCMPLCFGSGGLAGQHRFGARSGASVILLGSVKVILGLVFGSSLTGLLARFPRVFLSVLLFAAGAELARVAEDLNSTARDLWAGAATDEPSSSSSSTPLAVLGQKTMTAAERRERFMVMIFTAGGVIAVKNIAIGLLVGTVCWLGYRFQDWLEGKPLDKVKCFLKRRFRKGRGDEARSLLGS